MYLCNVYRPEDSSRESLLTNQPNKYEKEILTSDVWNFPKQKRCSNLGWNCYTETIEAFLKTFGISEIAVCAVRPSPTMSYVRRIWLARRSVGLTACCRCAAAAAAAALRIIIERARRRRRRRLLRPTWCRACRLAGRGRPASGSCGGSRSCRLWWFTSPVSKLGRREESDWHKFWWTREGDSQSA